MTKRWPVFLLIFALLFGCAGPEGATIPSEPTSETLSNLPSQIDTQTKPTESVGFYLPVSIPEPEQQEPLRTYPLNTTETWGIRFLGEDLLLFSGYGSTTLTLLAGTDLCVKASVTLSQSLFPGDSCVVDPEGLTYTDEAAGMLVFLDQQLQETHRYPLPKKYNSGLLSADRSLFYYCTSEAVRCLDLQTDVDRPVKEMDFLWQELSALHYSDTILQCGVIGDDGNSRTLFLSAHTGELLREIADSIELWTGENFYFTTHMDGEYQELIAGSLHFGPSVLVTESEAAELFPLPECDSLLLYSQAADHQGACLDLYRLETGQHTARLLLSGNRYPVSLQAGPDGLLWFLCYEETLQQDVLCTWDPNQTATGDSRNYLQPRRSQTQPDWAGLAQCQALADEISARQDVDILLWTDATQFQPWDYTLTPEYQVPLIHARLLELEQILSRYPAGFLREAASQTGSGRLKICLVREIRRTPESNGPESAVGLQYWDEYAEAYLAITLGVDMEQHLYHELFHIIDSRILSSCDAFDQWETQNPSDFHYSYDYTTPDQKYWRFLSGEERCFIDLYAMSYPKEDRARIMEYAMLDHQADTFASPTMQTKLRQLCVGIRTAFHLEQSLTCYPWEQYLVQPLAPKP